MKEWHCNKKVSWSVESIYGQMFVCYDCRNEHPLPEKFLRNKGYQQLPKNSPHLFRVCECEFLKEEKEKGLL